jgi:hypothetical protein
MGRLQRDTATKAIFLPHARRDETVLPDRMFEEEVLCAVLQLYAILLLGTDRTAIERGWSGVIL